MSRTKSQASVTERLNRMRFLFADLRESLVEAEAANSSDTLRAALIVSARAINLFVGNYSVSEHLADTQLVQLNSRMIRLTNSASDLSEAYSLTCSILDSIHRDIDTFALSFKDETDTQRLSSKVQVDDSADDSEMDDFSEDA